MTGNVAGHAIALGNDALMQQLDVAPLEVAVTKFFLVAVLRIADVVEFTIIASDEASIPLISKILELGWE